MAGKFLKRAAIIDTVKSEHAANAVRRRRGLKRHPILAVSCGCPDPACGAYHVILTGQTIPTAAEADRTLAADKKARKAAAQARQTNAPRRTRKQGQDSP